MVSPAGDRLDGHSIAQVCNELSLIVINVTVLTQRNVMSEKASNKIKMAHSTQKSWESQKKKKDRKSVYIYIKNYTDKT